MNAIVAVDLHWGIGKDHKLLYRLPEDMHFFRAKTLDQTVICGRKTLESFPDQKPLPRREHIVLSRTQNKEMSGVRFVKGLDELSLILKGIPTGNVWVIGGESVYRQLYRHCENIYVTKIFADSVVPDTYFPDLDQDPHFSLKDAGTCQTSQNGLKFQFQIYQNINVLPLFSR